MRCSDARNEIIERELGWLDTARSFALDRHLRECSNCMSEAVAEQRLIADFASLRGEAPFEVDVAPQVMSRLAARFAPRVPDFTVPQLGLSATAAAIAAFALIVMAFRIAPDLEPIVNDSGAVLNAMRGMLERAGNILIGLLAIPFKLIGMFFRSMGGFLPLLKKLEPVGMTVGVFATFVMMTTIAYFVGRDLLNQAPAAVTRSESR